MSLRLPRKLGPQTTSSPETTNSIPTPEYNSITAQEIRRKFSRMTQPNQRLPTLEEYSNRENAMNTEVQNLRNYVDASIGAIQASLRRTIEKSLAEILPQAVLPLCD